MSNYVWTLTMCMVEADASHKSQGNKDIETFVDKRTPPDADPLEALENLFRKVHRSFDDSNYSSDHVLWLQLSLHKEDINNSKPHESFSHQFKKQTKVWNPRELEEAEKIFSNLIEEKNIVKFTNKINP